MNKLISVSLLLSKIELHITHFLIISVVASEVRIRNCENADQPWNHDMLCVLSITSAEELIMGTKRGGGKGA